MPFRGTKTRSGWLFPVFKTVIKPIGTAKSGLKRGAKTVRTGRVSQKDRTQVKVLTDLSREKAKKG